jgi:hypothetical protein
MSTTYRAVEVTRPGLLQLNGIMLPMKRRAHPADAQRRKVVAEPVLVAIDFHEIAIQ